MEAEHTQRRDYKAQSRKGSSASPEVGGVHKPVDRKENITLREGRNPASVGVFSWEEEPVTAKGQSLRAQRTNRKVRVLQEILYTAAKKDKKRTFGILYDKACRWEVLWIAWIRVQRNKGAPGVDGRTIEAIKRDGEVAFIKDIQRELLDKHYRPRAIRREFIVKANGKLRPLGIPVVKDRVVQGAVKMILEPIFEANFCEGSYGFRPGRGSQEAIKAVRKWVTYGYSHVIDADIHSFFDKIDHELILSLVRRRVRDKWILRLIRWWLKAKVFEQDRVYRMEEGTPQGGVISPLLANIALHPLDKYWEQTHRATKLVRYCDDFVVLTRWKSTQHYRPHLDAMIKRLGLSLSKEKTREVEAQDGFDFLGVRFVLKPTRRDSERKFCYGFPTQKAMKKIRGRIRQEIGKDTEKSLPELVRHLNPVLRGWSVYYRWLNSSEHFHKIDRYVSWKMLRWLRRKQQRTRRAFWLPFGWFHEHGLYRLSGQIVRVS